MLRFRIVIAFLCLFTGASLSFTTAHSAERQTTPEFDGQPLANFYQGKIVRIVVGFPPGGGADVYSRLIARHLGRHIPGDPTNHIFNNGARDGSEIGMLNGAVILEQLFANPGVHFDMAKFRYLAVPVNETYVMVVTRQSGVAKFAELVGANSKPLTLGAIPNSTLEHAPILLREALQANLKIVAGYKGSADIRLASDSGEIGGFFNPWSTVKLSAPDKFKSAEWSVIAQLSDTSLPNLPAANIPTIIEMTKDENQRALLRYGTSAPNQFGKVYMLPRGVPAERAAALEAAFAKTLADRAFLAEAEKGKLEITPIYGAAIDKIVSDFLAMPATIKARLEKALRR
jgi:tripartite-type tricarboxylate transporter receptor subunit TctC